MKPSLNPYTGSSILSAKMEGKQGDVLITPRPPDGGKPIIRRPVKQLNLEQVKKEGIAPNRVIKSARHAESNVTKDIRQLRQIESQLLAKDRPKLIEVFKSYHKLESSSNIMRNNISSRKKLAESLQLIGADDYGSQEEVQSPTKGFSAIKGFVSLSTHHRKKLWKEKQAASVEKLLADQEISPEAKIQEATNKVILPSIHERDMDLDRRRFMQHLRWRKQKDRVRAKQDSVHQIDAIMAKSLSTSPSISRDFHNATKLACTSNSELVRRDAAQAVATLLLNRGEQDVLMTGPETLQVLLDVFDSNDIDTVVRFKVLQAFALLLNEERYRALILDNDAQFHRLLNLQYGTSVFLARAKATALANIAHTKNDKLKIQFQKLGGFDCLAMIATTVVDNHCRNIIIHGMSALLTDVATARMLRWPVKSIVLMLLAALSGHTETRVVAVAGLINCTRSVHNSVVDSLVGLRTTHKQSYHKLLSFLKPLNIRKLTHVGVGEITHLLKFMKELLQCTTANEGTMNDIFDPIVEFLPDTPQAVAHASSLQRKRTVDPENLFGANVTVDAAFFRLFKVQQRQELAAEFTKELTPTGGSKPSTPRGKTPGTPLYSKNHALPEEAFKVSSAPNLRGTAEAQTARSGTSTPLPTVKGETYAVQQKRDEEADQEDVGCRMISQALVLLEIILHSRAMQSRVQSKRDVILTKLMNISRYCTSLRLQRQAGCMLVDFASLEVKRDTTESVVVQQPRILQTICALVASEDCELQAACVHLVRDVSRLAPGRQLLTQIGCVDLLRNVQMREGSNSDMQGSVTIALTNLSLLASHFSSQEPLQWLDALEKASGSGEQSILKAMQEMVRMTAVKSKDVKLRSSMRVIVPWMRAIMREDTSTAFLRKRYQLAETVLKAVRTDFAALALQAMLKRLLFRIRMKIKNRAPLMKEERRAEQFFGDGQVVNGVGSPRPPSKGRKQSSEGNRGSRKLAEIDTEGD